MSRYIGDATVHVSVSQTRSSMYQATLVSHMKDKNNERRSSESQGLIENEVRNSCYAHKSSVRWPWFFCFAVQLNHFQRSNWNVLIFQFWKSNERWWSQVISFYCTHPGLGHSRQLPIVQWFPNFLFFHKKMFRTPNQTTPPPKKNAALHSFILSASPLQCHCTTPRGAPPILRSLLCYSTTGLLYFFSWDLATLTCISHCAAQSYLWGPGSGLHWSAASRCVSRSWAYAHCWHPGKPQRCAIGCR